MIFMSGNGNHINFFLICRGLKPSLVRIQAGGPTANDTGRRTKCMNTEEALWIESGSICWGTVADRLKDQGRTHHGKCWLLFGCKLFTQISGSLVVICISKSKKLNFVYVLSAYIHFHFAYFSR